MTRTIVRGRGEEPLRVLIAGAGVGGLESLLALRALARDRVAIEMLAPDRDYVDRPFAVAEPFGLGMVRSWPLAPIVEDQRAVLHAGVLAEVDPGRHTVRTRDRADLPYDVLVLATGARRWAALPGAVTFRGAADRGAMKSVLRDLERGDVRRAAFAVPGEVAWALPLYELALMTAAHLARRGVRGVELALVTHEPRPLGAFGPEGSAAVAGLLERAGIELRTGRPPIQVAGDRLLIEGGAPLRADRVVALPALDVPPIPGLPQGPRGFLSTDVEQRVEGVTDVYAVGDATSFPIKQGGFAAQQADIAARSIAARARRMRVPAGIEPWQPILRGVLLTGEEPYWLRSGGEGAAAAGPDALWWPPSKVAGARLAPYLAHRAGESERSARLADLPAPGPADADGARERHHAAVELALDAADAAAGWGDRDEALRWLDIAEQVGVVLPPEYAEKRAAWSHMRTAHVREEPAPEAPEPRMTRRRAGRSVDTPCDSS